MRRCQRAGRGKLAHGALRGSHSGAPASGGPSQGWSAQTVERSRRRRTAPALLHPTPACLAGAHMRGCRWHRSAA
jgi:hypothetical protein